MSISWIFNLPSSHLLNVLKFYTAVSTVTTKTVALQNCGPITQH